MYAWILTTRNLRRACTLLGKRYYVDLSGETHLACTFGDVESRDLLSNAAMEIALERI